MSALPTLSLVVVGAVALQAVAEPGAPAGLRERLPAPGDVAVPDAARELLARPLTADSAVQVAVLNNRSLRAALRGLGVYEGRVVAAGTLPNPEFEFDLREPRDDDPLQADVFLGFDLSRALMTGLRTDVAGAVLAAERLRVQAELASLSYLVRSAFYAAQAAEQSLALATRGLDALAAARDAARALFEAGNVVELDVATQEAAYEEARLVVAAQELERLERFEALRRLLGVTGADAKVRLAARELPPPNAGAVPPDVEARAVAANLQLRELASRRAAAANRTQLEATLGWVPHVGVDVHAEQDGERWELGGGMTIELPVFDRRQGPLAEAEAEFDALGDLSEGIAVDVRSAAREARARVESAAARVKHYAERIVPARRRVFEQTLLQYNAMQIGVFPLLAARRGVLDAELGQVASLRDYWTAVAALDALLAGRPVESFRLTQPGTAAAPADMGGH